MKLKELFNGDSMFQKDKLHLLSIAETNFDAVKAVLNKTIKIKSPIKDYRVITSLEFGRLEKVFNIKLTKSDIYTGLEIISLLPKAGVGKFAAIYGAVPAAPAVAVPVPVVPAVPVPAAPVPVVAAPVVPAAVPPVPPPAPTNYKLTNTAQHCGFNHELPKIVSEFAGRIKRFVDFSVPHNTRVDPLNGPNFNVFVWSSPGPEGHYHIEGPLWGKTGYIGDSLNYDKWDDPLIVEIRSPEGKLVAAYNEDNLYIYFDVVHKNSQDSQDILKSILAACDPNTINLNEKDVQKEIQKRYIDACLKYSNNGINTLKNKIDQVQKTFDTARTAFINAARELDIYNKDLMKAVHAPNEDRFIKEFEMLSSHPDIKKIRIQGSLLSVFTKNIFMKNGDITYDIGEFQISIELSSFRVTYKNLTRSIDTAIGPKMQHPHIYKDGHQCQGTAQAAFSELIAAHEYGNLVDFAISFLKQANIKDSRYMSGWPIVDKPVAIKSKKIKKANLKKKGTPVGV